LIARKTTTGELAMIRNEQTGVRLLLALIAMAIVVPQLTGCNTMQGAGKDIENAGEAIQDEAEEKK
jgi:entericidin B